MAHIPPTPDATSNQFKRSIVSGRFVVQDRYESYGATGSPSGNIIDSGNSYFYGDVSVSGVFTVLNSASLPNHYNTTQSNERYYTKEYIDGIPLGKTGYTGFTGAAGVSGARGDTGFTGSAGVAGARGDTGFTGSAGVAGAKGDTGFTGSQGVAGTNYFTQSGSDIYYNTGNVGIKKVPTSTLDVNGTLTTGILNIGNYLKTGGTATLLSSSVNLTFPIDSYYYVYENYISGYLEIRLPDVHNQTIPPFQFTIVNMYAYATYGLQPYSSNASTPTFLYSKTRQQLASRNQTYDVPTSTTISIFTTIHYFDKNWYIM